ncbi:MAG TPA: 1-(5-phosphoribosyl)-5-[(5-phosphoribosylamino)methylideneamino]imidazole-4-carboxamide isomerase [bacterium]|nr:1-(5-phosphoribosyl)-5-[(5-phosphoribosylamino)methylideneamino]imidazole-4-carboxamide isomerase [bacterium]
MRLYPAIDLLEGKCVRLQQGKRELCTVYSDRPEQMAMKWVNLGARWLHVIDLEAAIDEKVFANREAIKRILEAVDVPVQIGGGIREAGHIRQYIEDGVERVIVSTKVLESRDFAKDIFAEFGDKIVVSIDSSDGRVAVKGWTDYTDLKTVDAVRRMQDDGARLIVLTDIVRDGMLSEPNFEMMAQAADALEIDLICAGGVSTVEHVEKLKALDKKNIDGAIIGKALYSGSFDLVAAIGKFPR